jgi:hypothetical protein
MELAAIGLIAFAFCILLCLPVYERRQHREKMGLPKRVKSWRDDPSVRWTDARYYSSARKRLDG